MQLRRGASQHHRQAAYSLRRSAASCAMLLLRPHAVSGLLALRTRSASVLPSRQRLGACSPWLRPAGARRGAWLRTSTVAEAGASAPAPSIPSIIESDGTMAKQYNFAAVEQGLYAWWEAQGYFKPAGNPSKPPYVVPMPPPNVTGYLHMGHAMFLTVQDILSRFHRMRGRPTLFLPGTDHAGIATQMLVERALAQQGISRQELGRQGFLDRVWQWKEEKGGYIVRQMRRLGASADWSRERFTLEPKMSAAVSEAFVRLHDKGLVYRGDYMVNWSPTLQTAVSDLEVDYTEEEGTLYYFKYRVAGGGPDDYIPVATTRPETILGDTAVCVHPGDERYASLVGRNVIVPLQGREVPVVADDYVDAAFGTGALKVTPGHDVNDYEIGKRQKLPTINIMNKDATINAAGGPYEGLDRFECRKRLWADLEAAGLAIRTEKRVQRVPRSQRSGEVIEPLVSAQWFVRTEGMAAAALGAVRGGDITIVPERFQKVWFNWLENIRDWCVSRQLWWGHRIPVWYAAGHDGYFVARDEAEARQKAAAAGVAAETPLQQDEDVLDTWFSSGLWPFATVGWPEEEGVDKSELSKFYPSAVLVTGYDILFFWVARMVMMGTELTGKSPFGVIYLHGLVRDAQGQKMSKTKGNVVDPIETIDRFGADALRYSLVTGVTPGQDIPLAMERVEANRNFANKLWNAGRFLIGSLNGLDEAERQSLAVRGPMSAEEMQQLALSERSMVSRCHQLVETVTAELEAYNLGDAGRRIYELLWDEYADWYLEASKTRMSGDAASPAAARQARRVLVYVFDTCLRLLHPFMPFVTEILWQQLPHHGEALVVAPWPKEGPEALPVDEAAVARFAALQALVRAVRNARAEYNVEAGKRIAASIQVADPTLRADVMAEAAVLSFLARLEPSELTVADASAPAPAERAVHLVVQEGLEAYLPLKGMIDAEKELARLTKQAERIRKEMEGLDKRLGSAGFADKAPPAVVEETTRQRNEKQEQLSAVLQSIDDLRGSAAAAAAAAR